ncbi:MAG TPA: GNAT family N-acetyltransferase [Allosphingosinicella sp.]
MSYRPITGDDLPFLASVYFSTRAQEVASTGWPVEMQHQFLAQQFDAQHRHYQRHYPDAEWLVIERNGEAVGRLYLEEWESQIRIIDLSLLPESRGLGIGAAIFEDTFELARAAAKKVSIHVEKNNPARRLYLRLGFEMVADEGVYDLMEWRPAANPS